MRRALWVLIFASACGDVDAAYQKYCESHPGQEGCVTMLPDGGGGGGGGTMGGGGGGGGSIGGGGGSAAGGGGGAMDAGLDAGTDGGTDDAGAGDAGTDAGALDAGFDAGALDAGFDAGALDAGTDAGALDAGLDAGTVDAGYRGPPLTNWDVHVGRTQACARSMVSRPNPAGGMFNPGDVYCWGDYSVENNNQTTGPHVMNLPVADQLVVGGLAVCVSYGNAWTCLSSPLHGRQGQPNGPDGGADFMSFGGGWDLATEFGCAIRGGALDCWDWISPRASFPSDVTAVSASAGHSFDNSGKCYATGSAACALFADGGASCWGNDSDGKLGADGGVAVPPTPLVTAPRRVLGVSAGGNTTCVTLDDHTVRCWGVLAAGATQLTHVSHVAVGACHACAHLDDAGVRCWGVNGAFQTGDDAGATIAVPLTPVGLGEVQTLQAGGNQTCATLRDGSVWCWGLVTNSVVGRFPMQVLP